MTSGHTGGFVPFALAMMAAIVPAAAQGQTDYYNTDRGRPFQVEDAYPVERRAFELQAAPLRLERGAGGVYHWSVEPEMAYGILPRTQLEIGVPLSYMEAGAMHRAGVGGLDVSVLHNLNAETAIPALAVAARALLPVGGLAPERPFYTVTGIATRTFTWMRFHLNAGHTFGDRTAAGDDSELSRWTAGLAMDKTFPLRSLLIGAELLVERPLHTDENVWRAGTGLRYQLSPRWATDAGIGRRITGDDAAWYFTMGSAYAFGLPWRR